MEIRQLEYYLELCKYGNFTEAGFACSLTQSALSKQLKKLESELGVILIRRDAKNFELTPEGLMFRRYAENALESYNEMLGEIRHKKEIRIGSMSVLSPYHFAKTLSAFREEYPDIKVDLDEKSADQIVADIEEYDFVILRSLLITEPEKYKFVPLYDDYLCAIVYPSHPLAGRKSIWLSELKDEKFIFPVRGTGGYEAFYSSCRQSGFEPSIQYEFPQANTIMSFVTEKLGITINFAKVYKESAGSELKMIPLKDDYHYPISLIYPRKRQLTNAEKNFVKFIQDYKQ